MSELWHVDTCFWDHLASMIHTERDEDAVRQVRGGYGAAKMEIADLRTKLAESERVSEARNTAMDAVEGALEEWFGAIAREDGTFNWGASAVDGIEHLKRTVAALREDLAESS